MSKCSSCGAAITWAKSNTGKAMPLQYDEKGDWSIDDRGVAWFVPGVPVMAPRPRGPRYSSHFSTCPNAAAHRKARG